jgi:Tol biopolymer transport system component/tRNA A-37 threonylcarbamoyl transferase component Bud32
MHPGPKPSVNQGDSSARSPEASGEQTPAERPHPLARSAEDSGEGAPLDQAGSPLHPASRPSPSALRPGDRIGAYRVERGLGRGGMGEVYLAFDDRLGRLVAIKRIRHDGPLSEVQRQRFRREARAAARLNHPAIVQIFDLVATGDSDSGRAGGSDSLVMEYVEGESLADIVARGPLDPAVAVRFAREIALGLAAAHAAGFVHRDLKTENVMVTASGAVKILDFGLVKSVWQGGSQGDEQSLTAEGIVLGTFHTISPEQVRGGEADARSDLFSLGVLLYELLSGQSPFRGGSHVESLRRILTYHPPPLSTTRPGLPRELGALVDRLLEKDPRRRPQTARDVAAALGEIAARPGVGGVGRGGGGASMGEETLSDRPTFPGGVLVAAPAIGDTPGRSPAGPGEAEVGPAEVVAGPGELEVEVGRRGEGVRSRASKGSASRPSEAVVGPARPASGRRTEGEAGASPPPVIVTRKLPLRLAAAKLPLRLAAAVVALCAFAVWLLLRPSIGRAPALASEGAPVHATFAQLTDSVWRESYPSLSPDGSFFLYAKATGGKSHIYLQRVGGGNPIDLSRDSPAADTHPAFSPDGQQIAFRSERDGGGIFIMGATGESVRRLTDFGYDPAWSPDGTKLLCASEGVADPATRKSDSQIWSVDATTGARQLLIESDAVQPSWSPHALRIAYWGIPAGSARRVLWTIPVDGTRPGGHGDAVPLVDDQYLNWSPVWAPDGKRLYFASDHSGAMNLWRVAIDEATGKALGEPEPLSTPSRWSGMLSISRDGRKIAYATRDSKSNLERIAFDPVAGRTAGPPQPVTQGSRFVRSCNASPDGRWIAFHSQLPQEDLFIVHPDGSDLRQLTNDRYKDRDPVWSPDSSRLAFYSNRGGSYELWGIRPDGSGLEQITRADRPGPTVSPIWSPDGRKLACLLNLRGTALVDLGRPWAERAAVELPRVGAREKFGASSWSPDGRWLAGVFAGGGVGLYSFQSSRYARLTEHGLSPAWLHDSSRLLYLDEGKLYLLDSRTRQARLVLEPPVSSGFRALSVGPGDRQLYLVRESDEGHIWMLTLSSPS